MTDERRIEKVAGILKQLSHYLLRHNLLLVTAESCTGGWVSQMITAVAGSSAWFERGLVTYSDISKQELLGVKPSTLAIHGAVSRQTAIEMAQGALGNSHAQVSLAITGIAGPSGGSTDKPVGTVFFAWASSTFETQAIPKHFSGTRTAIREQCVAFSLQHLLQLLENYRA